MEYVISKSDSATGMFDRGVKCIRLKFVLTVLTFPMASHTYPYTTRVFYILNDAADIKCSFNAYPHAASVVTRFLYSVLY